MVLFGAVLGACLAAASLAFLVRQGIFELAGVEGFVDLGDDCGFGGGVVVRVYGVVRVAFGARVAAAAEHRLEVVRGI